MINWSRRKYSKEEFIEAWNASDSIAEVARRLGCNLNGGGYHTLRAAAKELSLNRDHMSGQAHLRGKTHSWTPRESLDTMLVGDRLLSSSNLKKRLWDAELLPRHCQMDGCGISEWLGQPAPLELDHINGIHTDNRIENLRILCRNCHGQTDTFGRRNGSVAESVYAADSKSASKDDNLDVGSNPTVPTCRCGRRISKTAKQCKSCVAKNRKTVIEWPSIEELLDRLQASNYTVLAAELGVSDNAIRKRIKKFGSVLESA